MPVAGEWCYAFRRADGAVTASEPQAVGLFTRDGVTFLREESIFHLGRVTIEIAPECSGIRSSLALFITATLAARLMLRCWWS